MNGWCLNFFFSPLMGVDHDERRLHGRMVEVERVPVERRIAISTDSAVPAPWTAKKGLSRKDSAVASHKAALRTQEDEFEESYVSLRGRRASGCSSLRRLYSASTTVSMTSITSVMYTQSSPPF